MKALFFAVFFSLFFALALIAIRVTLLEDGLSQTAINVILALTALFFAYLVKAAVKIVNNSKPSFSKN